MSTIEFDQGMQPAVHLATADCDEGDNQPITGVWTMAVGGATIELPVAFCPFPSLQHHGYLHWLITGDWTGTAGAANAIRFHPRSDGALPTNAAALTWSGLGSVTGPAYFQFEAKMTVVGSTLGVNRQLWTARLTVIDVASVLVDTSLATYSAITQTENHDVGWAVSLPAGDATMNSTKVRSVTCTHVGKRNGS